jgi:hypothetical protein
VSHKYAFNPRKYVSIRHFFSNFTLPQNSIILLNAMYRFDVIFPEIKQRRGRRGARSSPAIPSPERGRCAASDPLSPAPSLCANPAHLPPAPDHLRSEAVVPRCSSPAGARPSANHARLPLALDHHGILQSSELARSGEHHPTMPVSHWR